MTARWPGGDCCDKSPTGVADRGVPVRSELATRPMTRSLRPGSMLLPRMAPRPKMVVAALALCAAAATLGGCGSGPTPVVDSTSTTAPAASTTQPAGAAGMALAAYRGMWADMVIASRTSDYQSPLLPMHASGAALSVLVRGLAKNQEDGIVTKGEPSLHPQVTSLSPGDVPTQATITDCVNDKRWLEYKTTGGLLNDTPGGHHATTAIVVGTVSGWKVTQLAVQAVGTC
jgi:hypothetical protein